MRKGGCPGPSARWGMAGSGIDQLCYPDADADSCGVRLPECCVASADNGSVWVAF